MQWNDTEEDIYDGLSIVMIDGEASYLLDFAYAHEGNSTFPVWGTYVFKDKVGKWNFTVESVEFWGFHNDTFYNGEVNWTQSVGSPEVIWDSVRLRQIPEPIETTPEPPEGFGLFSYIGIGGTVVIIIAVVILIAVIIKTRPEEIPKDKRMSPWD